MNLILMTAFSVSIIMSVTRNMLSKAISVYPFGTKNFFKAQCLIFFTGAVILTIPAWKDFGKLSLPTLPCSFLYALLLIAAQWNYTAALGKIHASVCVTIYSCGFIFPTLSGTLFWNEEFTVLKFFSLILTTAVIFTANYEKKTSVLPKKDVLRPILAMMASGGLGIMQKYQQTSSFADEGALFVMLAFCFAGMISLICERLSKAKSSAKALRQNAICPCIIGGCFACCNLLNTYLAGKLDSAFFFPVQNMAVIIISIVVAFVFFKERLGKREAAALILGIGAIVLNR